MLTPWNYTHMLLNKSVAWVPHKGGTVVCTDCDSPPFKPPQICRCPGPGEEPEFEPEQPETDVDALYPDLDPAARQYMTAQGCIKQLADLALQTESDRLTPQFVAERRKLLEGLIRIHGEGDRTQRLDHLAERLKAEEEANSVAEGLAARAGMAPEPTPFEEPN